MTATNHCKEKIPTENKGVIVVKEVTSKCQLRKFVQFGNDIYKGNPYYCPPMFFDEMNIFNPKMNPALEVCEYVAYMAYRNDEIVGRIVGIINHRANEAWNVKKCRFGWFDFIDDYEVFKTLLDKVAEWGRSKGMHELNGPVGFTDFDKAGLLIEGFDQNVTLANLYNHPYYVSHYERYGMLKEADWIELQIQAPREAPERVKRIAKLVSERFNLKVAKVRSVRELKKRFGYTYFDVFDEAYQKLYNFQPLTDRQKRYYSDMFFPFLNFDFVSIVVDENDRIVGVGVGMPSISAALRKCGGKLFPFGWIHLIKALKAKKIADFELLLIAVRPEYQDMGVNALIIDDMAPYFAQYEVVRVETNSILEDNHKSLGNFLMFPHIQHKRRRAFIKPL